METYFYNIEKPKFGSLKEIGDS